MKDNRSIRIMWLLNHGTAREFELDMMRRLGFEEFFLPKIIPQNPEFRSGSVDWSKDAHLTIPRAELDILNATDWYGEPSAEAWAIANRYFDILFFIVHNLETPNVIARNFRGAAIWRVYGRERESNYTSLLRYVPGNHGEPMLRKLGNRFWFGMAYDHLDQGEGEFLRNHVLYLPLGLAKQDVRGDWTGEEAKILFVCAEVAINSYYRSVYLTFKKDFEGFPYAIGGFQSLKATDPALLGFVPKAQHEANMRRFRVMFYHSTEPNHVHYHPFEAVRAGMPLVFMAGGLLDALGGVDLPGRCKTIAEARKKIRCILDGDRALIASIRKSQSRLLAAMNPENCVGAWRAGMTRVLQTLQRDCERIRPANLHRPRIAVILPHPYGGGTLRSAKQLAQALYIGSREAGEPAEIVFGHLADEKLYPDEEFDDLPPEIKRRVMRWIPVHPNDARVATDYAARNLFPSEHITYSLPDDGINHFLDCDLWVIASDRLPTSILPLRPYVMIVHDYIQRYDPIPQPDANLLFPWLARQAELVVVTSEFTYSDALQFAGLSKNKLRRLPLMLPRLVRSRQKMRDKLAPYFVWPTNLGRHKNHAAAAEALRRYYEEFDGQLECRITGIGTDALFKSDLPHLAQLRANREASPLLKRRSRAMGALREPIYAALLANAEFLWHAARIDNGSFSVIEAASSGVPALSSDYPAMHEIDTEFQLGLSWMDPNNPADMARQLKFMEENAETLREALPGEEVLRSHSVERLAPVYWEAMRRCL